MKMTQKIYSNSINRRGGVGPGLRLVDQPNDGCKTDVNVSDGFPKIEENCTEMTSNLYIGKFSRQFRECTILSGSEVTGFT